MIYLKWWFYHSYLRVPEGKQDGNKRYQWSASNIGSWIYLVAQSSHLSMISCRILMGGSIELRLSTKERHVTPTNVLYLFVIWLCFGCVFFDFLMITEVTGCSQHPTTQVDLKNNRRPTCNQQAASDLQANFYMDPCPWNAVDLPVSVPSFYSASFIGNIHEYLICSTCSEKRLLRKSSKISI